jgi:hypothetical protein
MQTVVGGGHPPINKSIFVKTKPPLPRLIFCRSRLLHFHDKIRGSFFFSSRGIDWLQ